MCSQATVDHEKIRQITLYLLNAKFKGGGGWLRPILTLFDKCQPGLGVVSQGANYVCPRKCEKTKADWKIKAPRPKSLKWTFLTISQLP